ncbi:MAG: hypothetical protein LBE83_04770 [Propionibacteriaceae bacterium]|nr:hypothetical protein [Propionibacteriaceae bacterium]
MDPATGRRERLHAELLVEPDIDKLVQWILDVAATRHAAWRLGEPDPFGLAVPEGALRRRGPVPELESGPDRSHITATGDLPPTADHATDSELESQVAQKDSQ